MNPKVFAGKGAKNNELILKLLFEKGYLTPWRIANEIAKHDKKRKGDIYHKAMSIQSLLIRKNGRLPYLVEKGFVEKNENGYRLTFNKGFCSALTLYKQIPKPAIDEVNEVSAIVPAFRKVLDLLVKQHPQALSEQYKIMQELTLKLLEKGLNLEAISNQEFNNFFADQYQESYVAELKKPKKKTEKWEPTPELKIAISELMLYFENLLKKQMEEFISLRKKYEASNYGNVSTSAHGETANETLGKGDETQK
jgi:hypothetical protein